MQRDENLGDNQFDNKSDRLAEESPDDLGVLPPILIGHVKNEEAWMLLDWAKRGYHQHFEGANHEDHKVPEVMAQP